MYINVLAVRLCCSFHRDCRVCIILHKYFRNKTDSNEIGTYDKVHARYDDATHMAYGAE